MFTGIIEELGEVVKLERSAHGGATLTIKAPKATAGRGRLREGESISVNGVCLTAKRIRSGAFSADLAPETLSRSNLGALKAGFPVNLERAMTATARFSGHIVQGHVDGVAKLVALDPLPNGNYWLSLDTPAELSRYLVVKGSVALNGISLTIARLDGVRLGVAIIPHTYANTNLSSLAPGDLINVECDVLAKHLEKLLEVRQAWPGGGPSSRNPQPKPPKRGLTIQELRDQGF